MFICAGNKESFDFAFPIGVGMVESAINLTRLVLFDRPEYLVFIGSAGSYGELEPFSVIESYSASNIEHCFFKNKCYTPVENIISFSKNISTDIIVNSSNYITNSKKISKKYTKLKIQAENMEFFSVLAVAKRFEIPVRGIFVITNYCFDNPSKQYAQNISKSKNILIDYINAKIN